jgi:thioredoxin 1
MMSLRGLPVCIAVLMMGLADASAAERFPYDAKIFASALDARKPILVHVTAPWRKECQVQKPLVAETAQRPEFNDLIIFDVDFDTQKEALRRLNVQKQSTLVVFKDKAEIARAVGITGREAIEALVKKVL